MNSNTFCPTLTVVSLAGSVQNLSTSTDIPGGRESPPWLSAGGTDVLFHMQGMCMLYSSTPSTASPPGSSSFCSLKWCYIKSLLFWSCWDN